MGSKTPHDLVIDETEDDEKKFDVGKLALGYIHEAQPMAGWRPGFGASADFSFYPKDLQPYYGKNLPVGFVAFVSLRPTEMSMEMNHAM